MGGGKVQPAHPQGDGAQKKNRAVQSFSLKKNSVICPKNHTQTSGPGPGGGDLASRVGVSGREGVDGLASLPVKKKGLEKAAWRPAGFCGDGSWWTSPGRRSWTAGQPSCPRRPTWTLRWRSRRLVSSTGRRTSSDPPSPPPHRCCHPQPFRGSYIGPLDALLCGPLRPAPELLACLRSSFHSLNSQPATIATVPALFLLHASPAFMLFADRLV